MLNHSDQSVTGWIRHSMTAKLFFTGFLVLLLLIPVMMVSGVVQERANTQTDAQMEVGDKWGLEQTVGGPVVSVPYLRDKVRYSAYFLPETLTIGGDAKTQIRQRGNYEIILYTTDLTLNGTFKAPNLAALGIAPTSVLWNEATLQMGISDLGGIQEIPQIQWGNSTLNPQPNARKDLFASGLTAPLPGFMARGGSPFSIRLTLNGSKSLHLLPMGSQTTAKLTSDWATPSFSGSFLPSQRTLDEKGFDSEWKVVDLNRSFPQSWTNQSGMNTPFFCLFQCKSYGQGDDSFGVDFILPVDVYQKTERSVKYAGLFIILTFLAFFLFELFLKTRIHPIQYLMVGFGLVLFYLLLLSFSEQMAFGLAYLIASAATLLLVSGYTAAFLRRKSTALILGGILAGLYTYLYVLLQREDYALLMGSIGLFVILAMVMFLTRKIDWYQAGGQNS